MTFGDADIGAVVRRGERGRWKAMAYAEGLTFARLRDGSIRALRADKRIDLTAAEAAKIKWFLDAMKITYTDHESEAENDS